MEDKMIMEGILWDTKVLSDLCLHGSIESGTKEVHEIFFGALKDILSMQHELYTIMSNEGWYQTSDAPQKNVDQVKQKFSTFFEKED